GALADVRAAHRALGAGVGAARQAELAGRRPVHAALGGVAALDAVAEHAVVAQRVAGLVLAGGGVRVAVVAGAVEAVVADRVGELALAALLGVAEIEGAEDPVVALGAVGGVDAARGRALVEGAVDAVVAVRVREAGRRAARGRAHRRGRDAAGDGGRGAG